MGHGYASYVADFIHTNEDYLVGQLVANVEESGFATLQIDQPRAWRQEIRLLKEQLKEPQLQEWFIVLEYEIPRRLRRPDVILLSPCTVFVIEFKIGARDYDSASCWQSHLYSLDIRDFHAESMGRRIVPVLCATDAQRSFLSKPMPSVLDARVWDLIRTNSSDLCSSLLLSEQGQQFISSIPINPQRWLNSPYLPTPTIMEAASLLYEGHNLDSLVKSHGRGNWK